MVFRDEQGRPSRHVADWWDVVDLDYTHKELWRYQIDTLKMWAEIVDGFRCDVASSVPLDFWARARQEVEAVRPGCIWLAESVHGAHVLGLRKQGAYCATDTELYRAFDMTYDYDIWPWFEGYLSGKNSLRQYIDMLNYQELTYPVGFIKMRCGENHDTPRLAHWVQDERRLRHWLAFCTSAVAACCCTAARSSHRSIRWGCSTPRIISATSEPTYRASCAAART